MKLFKDLDEHQFYLTIWSGCLTTIIIVATIIAVSAYTEDTITENLVKEGHDPLRVACLYNMSERLQSTCFMLAQQKNAEKKDR